MSDIETALAAWFERMASEPSEWGRSDCILNGADWLISRGRPDPAIAYRGRYRTALGAARILKRHGGLEALVASVMGPAASGEPAPGDVGIVEAVTAWRGGQAIVQPVCAICAGGGQWGVKTADGLLIGEITPLVFWKV